MKTVYTIVLFVFISILTPFVLNGQGCVCIRQMSCTNATIGENDSLLATGLNKGDILINNSYRWFKSFRHFRGKHEEPDRVSNGSEVINNQHALDINISYALSNRWLISAALPFVYNSRSSLYEHGRMERHSTESYGLADIRLSASFWMCKPQSTKGNFALGLGIKLPTGNWNATDKFYNVGANGGTEIRNVDQSIQVGDGGVGFSIEAQGFLKISPRLYGYGNAFYLFNPKETNGARTYRETLSPILANESIMSVADQYLARGGVSYTTSLLGKTAFSLGARYEGVPVEDLIGGSKGFRRPGYIVSIEPGIVWKKGIHTASIYVPVALVRVRPQSVTDKEIEEATNTPRNGDAAFADYSLNFSYAIRISR